MMEGWVSDRESHLSIGCLPVIRLPLEIYCANTVSHSADHRLLRLLIHLMHLACARSHGYSMLFSLCQTGMSEAVLSMIRRTTSHCTAMILM